MDLPVDYESLAKVGSIMGSGGLIVLDEDSCSVDIARYFLSFTQEESCGKCSPCRVGTRAMLGILEAITAGKGTKEHLERLERLARTIKDGSLCGLGQTAPNPVLTTLRYFREEYEEHIEQKKCRAFVCRSLLELHIDKERCIGCEACKATCPTDGIAGERDEPHVINQEVCTQCGMCLQVCPPKYAAVFRISGDLTRYEEQKKKKSQRTGVAT
jgi:Na+-translocating ferredoxin:NAD+ oxidoreductase RNF subunit RnfB